MQEVRNALDIGVMKGQVYLDGVLLSNILRIEYRGGRLIEAVRQKHRYCEGTLMGWVKLLPDDATKVAESTVHLHYDRRIDGYYVELWETLEPPEGNHHDFHVLNLMGHENAITRIASFVPAMADLGSLMEKFSAFGLRAEEIDGHDEKAIAGALDRANVGFH